MQRSLKLLMTYYSFHYNTARQHKASVERKAAKTNRQEWLLTEGL
jgi:hypothetical protein